MNLELLRETLAGQPAYRSRQVWEWAARGVASYGEMTNLPAGLRAELEERVPFSSLEVATEETRAGRDAEGALPDARRPSGRGGADALPRRAALGVPLVAVRLPADLHVLRHGPDGFGRNLTRRRDPRPGAPLPPDRADRPRRLHGHGRADAEPRPGARGRAAAARPRRHPPADDDLDRRLAAGPDAVRRRGRGADPARALAPRADRRAPQPADAGERPLSARGGARRVPALRRAARAARSSSST